MSAKLEITVTQAEVTDYITKKLSSQNSTIVQNPTVVFQPGQVVLSGVINRDGFAANARVVMTVHVDAQGQPQVNVIEANLGPIPLPASMLSSLTDAVDQAIADSIKEYQSQYRLESITFTSGQATIVLVKK